MTIGRFRLRKEVKSLNDRKPDDLIEVPGLLGNGVGVVIVPNRSGYVYVRLRSQLSETIQAYNDQVSPVDDLPVIVTRHLIELNRWRIKGTDLGQYGTWDSSYVPDHATQHSLDPLNPGGDIAWIYNRQMMPLNAVLCEEGGCTGTRSVVVKSFLYYRNSDSSWQYMDDTESSDFPVPSGTNSAMNLLYLDTAGALQSVEGSSFDPDAISGSVLDYLPTPPADCFVPIAGVYLNGTPGFEITWDDIYDVRPWFNALGGGVGGSGTVGPMGPQGPQGIQGIQGLTGPQGPAGPSGSAGADGVAGPTGPSGGDHLVIYDDSVFKVTGSAIDFGSNLSVSVTGTVAFVTASTSDTSRVLIEQQTPTGTSNVSFTSIPSTYTHLEFEIISRTDKAAVSSENLNISLNNDTTDANYRRQNLGGSSSTASAIAEDTRVIGGTCAATATAGEAGYHTIKITFYAQSTFRKNILAYVRRREAATTTTVAMNTIFWEDTSAVNRVDFDAASSGNFISGSIFRLYGIN